MPGQQLIHRIHAMPVGIQKLPCKRQVMRSALAQVILAHTRAPPPETKDQMMSTWKIKFQEMRAVMFLYFFLVSSSQAGDEPSKVDALIPRINEIAMQLPETKINPSCVKMQTTWNNVHYAWISSIARVRYCTDPDLLFFKNGFHHISLPTGCKRMSFTRSRGETKESWKFWVNLWAVDGIAVQFTWSLKCYWQLGESFARPSPRILGLTSHGCWFGQLVHGALQCLKEKWRVGQAWKLQLRHFPLLAARLDICKIPWSKHA